jgi:D-alanyl-D-alanine carboxypeptidase
MYVSTERLASLTTEHKRFVAEDSVQVDDDVPPHVQGFVDNNLHKNKFFDQCQAAKNLDLKIGAQGEYALTCISVSRISHQSLTFW